MLLCFFLEDVIFQPFGLHFNTDRFRTLSTQALVGSEEFGSCLLSVEPVSRKTRLVPPSGAGVQSMWNGYCMGLGACQYRGPFS